MPKLKSHRGAKKRFKLTAHGKVRYKRACLRHLLSHKSSKRKRNLGKPGFLSGSEAKFVRRLISL